MDKRLKFVARRLEGESMTQLCREFGIARKTGYKIWERYQDCGVAAFADRSRRPYRHANQLPPQVEACIVGLKRDYPGWGARKLRERLKRRYPDLRLPAKSTIHAVLDRQGLVVRRKRARPALQGTPLGNARAPNDLWCTDYKGEFLLGNHQYCYPLTITDQASRMLLACDGLGTTQAQYAFTVFERVFRERGLPRAIRSDNGVPFAVANSLYALSKLSVWWLRLGIAIERIQPGCPQQNGRHERMHLTLKQEATRPAGANFLQQQERFDHFLERFNTERPHEALGMRTPAEVYTLSPRPYRGLPEVTYPFHDRIVTVTHCGRICVGSRKIHLTGALAGQPIGLKEVEPGMWLVSFLEYDLGYFDDEANRVEPIVDPFGSKVSPM